MTIYFYSTIDAYGCFSNFSRHGFGLGGCYWPTAEHYFQAQKFAGTEYMERVARETPLWQAWIQKRLPMPTEPSTGG